MVFPGGGYRDVWVDKEGYDVARWLNLIGVTAVVVKYRTAPAQAPSPAPEDVRDKVRLAALADAQRAMRLVRHHAAEWGIDPGRVGTVGFSAGGHCTPTPAGPARTTRSSARAARPTGPSLSIPASRPTSRAWGPTRGPCLS